jgi:spermidine synthase
MSKNTFASAFGTIRLVRKKKTGTLTYVQKGGNQSAVDQNGTSLDTYIHALYGLLAQTKPRDVLMIGCGGGTLGKMLAREGKHVTIVDIDKKSFQLAKRYFGLPPEVACHVGDGLSFLQKTRKRFDALIIDAFIGENIPAHMTGDALCQGARKCLRPSGAMLVNVCLNDKDDSVADDFARRLRTNGWSVRLLDQRGTARNAVIAAGHVKKLKRPKLVEVPLAEVGRIRRELHGMRFRRLRRDDRKA